MHKEREKETPKLYKIFFNFVFCVKDILELSEVLKILLNFQKKFKNAFTVSFELKSLVFYIKNTPKLSKVITFIVGI